MESENEISRAPTKKNLTLAISTSDDEQQQSPTKKSRSSQLQSVFEKEKNKTAMEAMMSELKKR